MRRSCVTPSSAAPWTCGNARRPNGSWIRLPGLRSPSCQRMRRISAAVRTAPGCGRRACTSAANASAEPPSAQYDSAATTCDAASRRLSSSQASTARARLTALDDMNASASPGPTATSRTCPRTHGRLPIRVSAISASAVRSPVPIVPVMCTAGRASVCSACSSASGNCGLMPLPPAASWLSRISIAARVMRASSRSPTPAAWLSRRRRSCSPASSAPTSASRLAPTPVVRP